MKRTGILENIVSIRKAKGYSQDYLASKIGMKQAGYGLIETGARGLQFDLLLRIAVALEMDVIDIITYPKIYAPAGDSATPEKTSLTKIQVELELSEEEFARLGLRDRLFRALGNDL